MSSVQVIGLPQSNFVWAVRIALAEKGVAHVSVPVPPHSPEVEALHPFGKIPVLRHGERVLCESRAIIDYIDAQFTGPKLVPADPQARLRCDMWTSIVTSTTEPLLVRQFLFAYMFPAVADAGPDRVLIDGLVPKVAAHCHVLEQALANGAIGGDTLDRTDAYLVPILFYLRNTTEGAGILAARPQLGAYLDRHLARPSVQATQP